MKPMLADDYVESKLEFPAVFQPKIDGVRALNLFGTLTGRSLKKFGNRFVTRLFSTSDFVGFDGELAAAHECDPALCRTTTSALGKHEGEPFVLWWIFDYITTMTKDMPYVERYHAAHMRIGALQRAQVPGAGQLRLMPSKLVMTLDELRKEDDQHVLMNYEGSIVRDPNGVYKYGRSSPKQRGLLRIKHFVEEDAVVIGLEEGETNLNDAEINALGHTERSTHAANMVPNGMVGTLLCRDVKTSQPIKVAAGCLTHDERRDYWLNPHKLVGQTIQYKTFKHGVKDKPRFPTFQSIRLPEDQ